MSTERNAHQTMDFSEFKGQSFAFVSRRTREYSYKGSISNYIKRLSQSKLKLCHVKLAILKNTFL